MVKLQEAENQIVIDSLHRLGDRLGVAKVVLLSLRIRAHILHQHQPCVVPKHLELAGEMMRAYAGLNADRAGGKVANRASFWPWDHFCRSTMAPR